MLKDTEVFVFWDFEYDLQIDSNCTLKVHSASHIWMEPPQFKLVYEFSYDTSSPTLTTAVVTTQVVQLKLETIRTLSREPGHRKFTADVLEYKQMRIYQSASQINKGPEQMCSLLLSPLVRQAVITTQRTSYNFRG